MVSINYCVGIFFLVALYLVVFKNYPMEKKQTYLITRTETEHLITYTEKTPLGIKSLSFDKRTGRYSGRNRIACGSVVVTHVLFGPEHAFKIVAHSYSKQDKA